MRRCFVVISASMLLVSFGCCCPQTSVDAQYSSPAPCGPAVQAVKHPEFTQPSIARVRQGMTVQEFEGIFGYPDRGHQREMGLTKVLIYEYDMARNPNFSHQFDVSNTFYFGVDQDPPYLKKWEIDYVHPVPNTPR
ncbi:MAG: hypothetical protein AB9866_06070 [Syntrophobacteraceae bacterium]